MPKPKKRRPAPAPVKRTRSRRRHPAPLMPPGKVDDLRVVTKVDPARKRRYDKLVDATVRVQKGKGERSKAASRR